MNNPDFYLFNLSEMKDRCPELTPYSVVCLQEAERMNILVTEIRRSLAELTRGLKGELNMTDHMEALMNCLIMNTRPPGWEKLA